MCTRGWNDWQKKAREGKTFSVREGNVAELPTCTNIPIQCVVPWHPSEAKKNKENSISNRFPIKVDRHNLNTTSSYDVTFFFFLLFQLSDPFDLTWLKSKTNWLLRYFCCISCTSFASSFSIKCNFPQSLDWCHDGTRKRSEAILFFHTLI